MPISDNLIALEWQGRIPLTIAATDGCNDPYDIVSALRRLGANPDVPDAAGPALLSHAAKVRTLSVFGWTV